MNVTISTWNIGSLYVDFNENIKHLENLMLNYGQDILCMQEFPDNTELVNKIMQWGGFKHFRFTRTSESHIQHESDMGVAVFSKGEITPLKTVCLPTPTVEISYNGRREYWHAKYFTAHMCEINGKSFLLVTGHGFPFHRYRLENPEGYPVIRPSFLALDEWLRELYGDYGNQNIYIAADFNISDPISFMPFCSTQFFDAFRGDATRPSGRKTDAIFLPNGCKLTGKSNFRMMNGDKPIFDHNFISVKIDI